MPTACYLRCGGLISLIKPKASWIRNRSQQIENQNSFKQLDGKNYRLNTTKYPV